MQNAALRAAHIEREYVAWDVAPDELARTFRRLGAEQGAGNITVPHKQAALELCERVSPTARLVGAVNTFWTEGGSIIGDNTDVGGFRNAVDELRASAPSSITIGVLGAGGAAAAVLVAISEWSDCRAQVWNRSPDRARALAARFPSMAVAVDSAARAVAGTAMVVNATTVGLTDDDVPIDPALIPGGADVIDLVYRSGETTWVREARARGHRACDGLPMLVEQGALAFERWFGVTPDRDAMWRALGKGRPAGSRDSA
jgi:shikimate dehydrogenase